MKFEVVFGVNPGYNHSNEAQDPVAVMNDVWLEQMNFVRQNSGLYISALVHLGTACYPKEHGAPDGGEDVVVVSGYFNEKYHYHVEDWKKAVRHIVLRCKEVMDQSTVALLFVPCEVEHYEQK